MKQVTFSGLLIVSVLFFVLYANTGKNSLVPENELTNYRKIESVSMPSHSDQNSWLIAKNEIGQLLKLSEGKLNIEMVKEKI